MAHFRHSRPGYFYLNDDRHERLPSQPSETPPFLRFAFNEGVALNVWAGEGAHAHELLRGAHLAWSVDRREVVIPPGEGLTKFTAANHYRALVRPDTQQIMSVVTSHYVVAENRWVARATEMFAQRIEQRPSMIAAVGSGRDGERSLFAARVSGDNDRAICLLAYNTHGGEGAVRFQLIECDRRTGTTYVLDSSHASISFPHVGDIEDRLNRASEPENGDTFVERYLAETGPMWEHLQDRLWTTRHTPALIKALWGGTPDRRLGVPGRPQGVDAVAARHPGYHLPHMMHDVSDAASAYRVICDWIDNRSEACERGDFTKSRDERLAMGAGNRYKRDAWKWITANV